MKNLIFSIIVLTIVSSCSNTNAKIAQQKVDTSNTEDMTVKEETNPEILVGKQDRSALEKEPYKSWFDKNYKEYHADAKAVKELSLHLENISIKVFMGTWCEDSQREVPAFYKILDHTSFDYKNLELITVTEEKDTPEGFEKGLDITNVPTLIFYKDKKEIGRFVEFARETLEKDMLTILSGKPYKHSYEE